MALSGVGLGARPEISGDLLRRRDCVSFVEVVAESCFFAPHARREALAFRELWPVVPHGVKLSLGSAEGIDSGRARALGALARELRAPVVTEHVAFVRSGGREIGHLTALPLTRAAVDVVAKNVGRARRFLPDVPLLLENVAFGFRWPEPEMSEGEFYSLVRERTGCDLLLDVGNLFANALNSQADPFECVEEFPLEHVGMVHIAGGVLEDGFYFDDHAHAIADGVFELLERVLRRSGPVPVLLERDAAFPPFGELEQELARARALLEAAAPKHRVETAPREMLVEATPNDLQEAEDAIARALTDVGPIESGTLTRFGEAGLLRSREILRQKRVEEAVPLLPCLGRFRHELEELARATVLDSVRPPRMAAQTDAIRIAERALARPELAAAARRDRLLLRARYRVDPASGYAEPRRLPFVGKDEAENGRRIWSVKGPGAQARVRVFEGGGKNE